MLSICGSSLYLGLGLIKIGVKTAFFNQFIVSATLCDHTVGNGDDPTGVANS